MSRVTPRKRRRAVRQSDLALVIAANAAVDKAMEKYHTSNPAKYHAGRPMMARCPFDAHCPFTAGDTG